MSAFESRITTTGLAPAIQLSDVELEKYRGAGWTVLRVCDDQIVEITYLHDVDDITEFCDELISSIRMWPTSLAYYLAMMSSTEAVDPVQLNNAADLARIARLHEEVY